MPSSAYMGRGDVVNTWDRRDQKKAFYTHMQNAASNICSKSYIRNMVLAAKALPFQIFVLKPTKLIACFKSMAMALFHVWIFLLSLLLPLSCYSTPQVSPSPSSEAVFASGEPAVSDDDLPLPPPPPPPPEAAAGTSARLCNLAAAVKDNVAVSYFLLIN